MPSYAQDAEKGQTASILNPFPRVLQATGGAGAADIFDMTVAGLGTMSPTIGTRWSRGTPPQAGAPAMLTHQLAHASGDCPTCNLVEIPYDPRLPRIEIK